MVVVGTLSEESKIPFHNEGSEGMEDVIQLLIGGFESTGGSWGLTLE